MVNPNFSNCVPAAIVNMIVKSTFFVKRGNKFRQMIADTDPAGHKNYLKPSALSSYLYPKLCIQPSAVGPISPRVILLVKVDPP